MNRIFITGDTHGVFDFDKLKRFAASCELDRTDYIIVAGDCSVIWSQELLPEYTGMFEDLGATILFVDGNHENFDMLYNYPTITYLGGQVHQVSSNIYHLCRGEIFEIYGKSFLALGGGESGDISKLKEHENWWKEEQITKSDYENAIENLSKHNNAVDIVVSHMPPTTILPQIAEELTCCGEELPWYIELKLIPKISHEYLQQIADVVKCKDWYFGHIHLDIPLGKYIGIYENIIEIK